jgi:hypothetical protein
MDMSSFTSHAMETMDTDNIVLFVDDLFKVGRYLILKYFAASARSRKWKLQYKLVAEAKDVVTLWRQYAAEIK